MMPPLEWIAPGGTSHALTGWMDGNHAPVMEGVYQRQARWLVVYSVWNGHAWLCSGLTIAAALQHRHVRCRIQDHPWRGLAAPPDGGYGRGGLC